MSNQSTILDRNNKRAMGGGNVKQGLVPQSTGFYGMSHIKNMRRANSNVSNTNVYSGLRLINYNGSVSTVGRRTAPSDKTGPRLAEVTPVSSPTNDTTPTYIFSCTEAGTITYGGEVSSSTRIAVIGNNRITLNALGEGTYNGTIIVTDRAGNVSNTLAMTAFTIDTTAPVLAETTPVSTPTNDTTPTYVFNSTQKGEITYGGGVSSSTTVVHRPGNHSITLNALAEGTYNGTIVVTDSAGNASNTLAMTAFTIDTSAPVLSETTPVATPSNDTTPTYVFNSTQVGAITYGGGVTSRTDTASVGANTITLSALSNGTYNGTIIVTDPAGNASNTLAMRSFTIDTTAPRLTQVSPTGNPFSVRAAGIASFNFVLTSTEAGTASFSGEATSRDTSIISGSNTLAMTPISGRNWTAGVKRGGLLITVTDTAGNASSLTFDSFTIS